MSSSLRQIQEQYLAAVHVIVEVRDARLPFTSASDHLDHLFGGARRRRLVVLNKADLADLRQRQHVCDAICRRCPDPVDVHFTSRGDHQALLPAIVKAADDRARFRTTPRLVMIVGVPNVGKSSIIRALKRDRKAVQVGARPGLTRAVSRLHLGLGGRTGPDLYLLDTPGILPPAIPTDLAALKLSLVHCLPEHVVGPYRTGQYLHEVVSGTEPTEAQFMDELAAMARRRSLRLSSSSELDLDRALQLYLGEFRLGRLGRFMLDPID